MIVSRVSRLLLAPLRPVVSAGRLWTSTYDEGPGWSVPPLVAMRRTVALAAAMGACLSFGVAVWRVIDADSEQVAAMGSAGTFAAVVAAIAWPRR